MGLKLSKTIARARGILKDTDETGYRYSSSDLLGYANDALDEILILAPFYFHSSGEIECTPNKCLQELPWDNAASLNEITSIKNGPAVTLVERLTMDRYRPGWLQDAAGPAVNWIRVDDNPMMFFVYPMAPAGQILSCIYVRTPDEFLVDDDTGLPPSLEPAIADYIVYRAESRDDEHVVSARAQGFLATFVARFQKAEKPMFKKEA